MAKVASLVGGGALCASALLASLSCSSERHLIDGGDAGESNAGGVNAPNGGDVGSGGSKAGSGGVGALNGGTRGETEGGMPAGGSTQMPEDGGSGGTGGSPEPVDPCAVDPCVNGGVCEAKGTEAVCSCDAAHEGDFCEKNVDDCAPKPCLNGGMCVDATAGYSCACVDGFSGVNCERVVSGCDDAPCLNSGTCASQGSSYKCTCKAGYSGTNCETNIDECASNPCKNGAACKDGVNGYTCTCKAGYKGTNCETDIDDCATTPCKNGGTCKDGVNSYMCTCQAGYNGTNCENDIDECAGSPCKNGGSCVNGVNKYTCSCTNRYTGLNCEYLEVKLVPSDYLGGGWATQATAISNDGKVVLLNATKGGDLAIGRLVDFGSANNIPLPPPYLNGSGFGLNSDGGVITGSFVGEEHDDAFKMVGGISTILDMVPVGWGANVYATGRDVSADGAVVVGTVWQGGGYGPFYCKTGQNCREVPVDASGIAKVATAVNGDGSIVVGYTAPADPTVAPGTAWRWVTSAAKAVSLTLGASSWSAPQALGISRNGQVIVGNAAINGVAHAIRWSGGSFTPTDLGTGQANATSSDGSVTVGVDGTTPIVWLGTTRNTLASLLGTNPDLSGATLVDAVAVSDDGKVVAATATVGGVSRALMVRLP
jgi:probable HAF family extracellular repeat protein